MMRYWVTDLHPSNQTSASLYFDAMIQQDCSTPISSTTSPASDERHVNGALLNENKNVPLMGVQSMVSRPSLHVSNCAVSLKWLTKTFMREYPVIAAERKTTGYVTYQILMPAVKAKGCRYVDLDEVRSGEGNVSDGREFWFISHCWSRPFLELVNMALEHFNPENQKIWRGKGAETLPLSEVYVWLDIFAINQNPGASQGNDLSQLKEVAMGCTQTLMILDPEGEVLTRIWCLFEAWHTGRKEKKGALRLLSYGSDWGRLEKVFIDLDVSKAKATVVSDLENILKDIEEDVGVLKMTHQIKAALCDSLIDDVPSEQEDNVWTEEIGEQLYKAARMCERYGRLSEAEPLFRRALEGNERVLGPDHPSTLSSVNNLATLFQAQGKLSEAEPLYRRALEGRERVSGPDHPHTLTSVHNLAFLFKAQGKLSEAEPLYMRALEGRERVLGPDHPNTLTSVHNLAGLLQALGKLSEAEPLQRRALEGYERVWGPDHPHTLSSVSLLGKLCRLQGKFEESEALQRRSLSGREKALGMEDVAVTYSCHRLALVLQAKGQLDEAKAFIARAVEGRIRVFGASHKDTMESVQVQEGMVLLQVAYK